MKKAILIVFTILLLIVSCGNLQTEPEFLVEFPEIYLENTSSEAITVESYYFDKHTNQDLLWKKQQISPSEIKQIMDWVYPKKIIIFQNDAQVFEYVGSNKQLIKTNLDTNIIEIGSFKYVFDDEKYVYSNIPFEKYDFGWLCIERDDEFSRLGLERDDPLCGVVTNLIYKE